MKPKRNIQPAAGLQLPVEIGELQSSPQRAQGALRLWNPQPIVRPRPDPAILELPAMQRSVEVVVYWLARTEHWISPSGWLRAWIRLNVWSAVVLAILAFTVVPAVTALVAGLTGLTLELSRVSDDLGRSFASLLPLTGTLVLAAIGYCLARRPVCRFPWTQAGKEDQP